MPWLSLMGCPRAPVSKRRPRPLARIASSRRRCWVCDLWPKLGARHERRTLVRCADAGERRGQSRAKSDAAGLRGLFSPLLEAEAPRPQDRPDGEAAVSALYVCSGRHGDAALAIDSIDLRRGTA